MRVDKVHNLFLGLTDHGESGRGRAVLGGEQRVETIQLKVFGRGLLDHDIGGCRILVLFTCSTGTRGAGAQTCRKYNAKTPQYPSTPASLAVDPPIAKRTEWHQMVTRHISFSG
ncbi:MAG: hypothetical protein RIA98_01070 [Algiphilus sp.]|uniref:hypothetical protein n=1 Tax=Algiphilus sp. TaxID=1872431 RepID=UPI0032EAE742